MDRTAVTPAAAVPSALAGEWRAGIACPALCLLAARAACRMSISRRSGGRHPRSAIHVAGTRGKSTTVRLIAAGLRAGGHRVVAKVTGTQPRIILPDGSERRFGAGARGDPRATRLGGGRASRRRRRDRRRSDGDRARISARARTLLYPGDRSGDHQCAARSSGATRLGAGRHGAMPSPRRCRPAAGCSSPPKPPFRSCSTRGRRATMRAVDCGRRPRRRSGGRQPAARARGLPAYGVAADDAAPPCVAAARTSAPSPSTSLRVDGRPVSFANAFSCNDVESFERLWRRHQPAQTGARVPVQPARRPAASHAGPSSSSRGSRRSAAVHVGGHRAAAPVGGRGGSPTGSRPSSARPRSAADELAAVGRGNRRRHGGLGHRQLIGAPAPSFPTRLATLRSPC